MIVTLLVPGLFLLLILAFATLSVIYVIKNNFAKETVEIIYPAIGAILLSGYLGYKSIVVNNPPPKEVGVTIGVLLDHINGSIWSMYTPRGTKWRRLDEFRGATLIDASFQDKAFASLDLLGGLRDNSGDSGGLPGPSVTNRIEDIVEYALLEWLSLTNEVRVGWQGGYQTLLLNGGGGLGKPFARIEVAAVQTALGVGTGEPNPLLRTKPILLSLPKGSRVIRSAARRYDSEIKTPHSTLRLRFAGMGSEPVRKPGTPDAERIYAILKLPPEPTGLVMYGLRLEFEARQNPFSRYSSDAKIEAQWIINIEQGLERDFSWDRLRALYTNP